MKKCKICGKDISDRPNASRYCVECAEALRVQRNRNRKTERYCEICGKLIKNKKSRKYCPECAKRVKYKIEPKYKQRRCDMCGEIITGRRYNAKYCLECAGLVAKAGNNKHKAAQLKRSQERAKKNKEPQYGDTSQCKTCRFWNKSIPCCDYYSITGQLRGCEPSPNCTKHEKGERTCIPFIARKENEDETGLFG